MEALIFYAVVLGALIAWRAVSRARERVDDFYHKHEMGRTGDERIDGVDRRSGTRGQRGGGAPELAVWGEDFG
jgi:hypothetical protein